MTKEQSAGWRWSVPHQQPCHVLVVRDLWGQSVADVWLPGLNLVARVRADHLQPIELAPPAGAVQIGYAVAASRITGALVAEDVLLAPLEGRVTPLPHQLRALARAMHGDRLRFLLADEVGLGKTIEAGLILRELKLRGLVRRVLVVAPKGLVTQWIAEMETRFGEVLHLLAPGDTTPYAAEENIWQRYDQVICTMDAVKPIESRRGWSREQVAAYNRTRFEHLVAAGWDLVIVDEAHRLGGSTDAVARYRLGQGLAAAAPALLLLSATPHQGKTDAFSRLVTLLDPAAVPERGGLDRARVQPHVIRTEKRHAIDARGNALFQPRTTTLVPIAWQARHQEQRALYEAVTDYVRDGYNRASAEHRNYVGFLMILLQRLVTSSTQAILTTLERRLAVLQSADDQPTLALPGPGEDEWEDLDAEAQVELLVRSRGVAPRQEVAEVRLLLGAAHHAAARGPDAKAEALLEWIYRMQQEETNPVLKVLIFTEFVPTQAMLRAFLGDRGFATVCLNGSMDLQERRRVQDAFAGPARVLISTDAGGEGLNLQFCHVVVNYDIPWNPMRLEQRIGRVDRIGQSHPVRALNFVLEDTVEFRVREVLEEKLALILQELGVDKTGDVLDSAQAGAIFDDLYVRSILQPDTVQDGVRQLVEQVQEQGTAKQTIDAAIYAAEPLDPADALRVLEHPLPRWVERLTTSALEAGGGKALRGTDGAWELTWPSGERLTNVVFDARQTTSQYLPASSGNPVPPEAISIPVHHAATGATPAHDNLMATLRPQSPLRFHATAVAGPFPVAGERTYIGIGDPRVQALLAHLPITVEGQSIPCLHMPGLPAGVEGIWSVWQITLYEQSTAPRPPGSVGERLDAGALRSSGVPQRHLFPIFVHDNGRVYLPTARHLWDALLAASPAPHRHLVGEEAVHAYAASRSAAEEHGAGLYARLVREREERRVRELARAGEIFAARRRVLERLGLPAVRAHRLAALDAEEAAWRAGDSTIEHRPDLAAALLLRIDGAGGDV